MIAGCPSCNARYRIEPERLRPDGVRLRCSRCESVFRVRPPVAQVEPAPEPAIAPASQPQPAAPSAAPPAPVAQDVAPMSGSSEGPKETSRGPQDAEPSRTVLIADSEVEAGKATAHAVAGWGLSPILVHDGVEAMMSIQRMLPRVVVMDAALPKMFGFQVCEVVKRNESLCDIHVVLVGAIHNRERYRRPPTELYGADSYVERHELLERLQDILDGIGMPTREVSGGAPAPVPSVPEPQPVAISEPAAAPLTVVDRKQIAEPEPQAETMPAPDPQPVAVPPAVEQPIVPEAPEPEVEPTFSPSEPEPTPQPATSSASPTADADPSIANAERLARIVVSDIILYNQGKFDTGVRDGNVVEVMTSDLAEGRSLFDARVDASVRGTRDFLVERLVEVARERGMS